MIIARTRLRKNPKSCKECPFALSEFGSDKFCAITKRNCPWEKSANGNWRYGKPLWCPLVEVKNDDRS